MAGRPSKYPNLPDKKLCPVCNKWFKKPESMGSAKWLRRVMCSQTCVSNNRRRTNDHIYK